MAAGRDCPPQWLAGLLQEPELGSAWGGADGVGRADAGFGGTSHPKWLSRGRVGGDPPLQQAQLEALAERLGTQVSSVRRQCEADRRTVERRCQQLEAQLHGFAGRLEQHVEGPVQCARDGELRERLSSLQGSVGSLMEEASALARRLESVEDRLAAKSSATEGLARQGARDLQQQVHALERQARLAAAAAEEEQRRQAARQRRTDHLLEDLSWRVGRAEDEQRATSLEVEVQRLAEELSARLGALEELCAAERPAAAPVDALVGARALEEALGASAAKLRDEVAVALEACAGKIVSLESKSSRQSQELTAALAAQRARVDAELERHAAAAARWEAAHARGVEALRAELAEEAARGRRSLEGVMAQLGQKVELAMEASDDGGLPEKVNGLVQRVAGGEALGAALRREMQDLRSALRAEARSALAPRAPPAPPRPPKCSAMQAPALHEQLGALADQLEALDEIASHVEGLDARVKALERDKRPP